MQSVKRTGREISRLVLLVMCILMVGLIGGCDPQLNEKLTAIDNQLASIDNRVTNIDNSVTEIDNRVTNIDNSVTEIDNRVTEIDNRVTEIDNRVTQMIQVNAGVEDGLDYMITYTFDNFEPVGAAGPAAENEKAAREAFFAGLQEWLDKAKGEGFQIDYEGPYPTPVRGYLRVVDLTNAQAVSPCVRTSVDPCTELTGTNGEMTHQDQIEAIIKQLAERTAQDPGLAVPVRKDPSPARLPVRHLTVVHNATSGVGESDMVAACQQIVTITIDGIPKDKSVVYLEMPNLQPIPIDSNTQVESELTRLQKRLVVEATGKASFDLPVPCGATIQADAYILVKLIELKLPVDPSVPERVIKLTSDDKQQLERWGQLSVRDRERLGQRLREQWAAELSVEKWEEREQWCRDRGNLGGNCIIVAQYRHLDIAEGNIKSDQHLRVPLIEGAPACPPRGPRGVNDQGTADYFMKALGEKCKTDPDWDQWSSFF